MGQFLAIGITTDIGIAKEKLDRYELSIEKFQTEMQSVLHFQADIYQINEGDEFYEFTLKDEIMAVQLLPFLQVVYPLLYRKSIYYDAVLEKLAHLPSEEWLAWSKEKSEASFQFDRYGSCDYLSDKYNHLEIHQYGILLSMEGKTSMEVYGRQFNFFRYTMQQAFKQFSIAGALRVYLTG